MIVKTIPSTWIREDEHRLDCGPFTSGSIETRKRLEHFPGEKDRLISVTRGGMEGIYHVGQDKLQFVANAEYGVPFLGSADILKADLSTQPYISKRQVAGNTLFQCPPGTTLITRSGTIGRMVYCRQEMAAMAISQDVLKVVPDTGQIPPGYLFAFLSSKYGVPMVVGGTFGSIIVHIEAANIADLPVPRLGEAVEQRVHALVDEAAQLRSKASYHRKTAIAAVTKWLGWEATTDNNNIAIAFRSALQRRFDAFHHSVRVRRAREILASAPFACALGKVVDEVFEPNRGARTKVDSEEFGVPFLSSSEVFSLDPTGEYLISKRRTNALERLLVGANDLLLPRSGQLGGIIGRAVLPLPTNYSHAASEHLVRVRCKSPEDAYYLWAVFASDPGYYAAIGTAYGSSIPSLDCSLISELRIPWEQGELREQIVSLVSASVTDAEKAIHCERRARQIVEHTIEGSA